MASLEYTVETPLTPNPDWPSGYSVSVGGTQAFDWGRNRFYASISHGSQGGIAVFDIDTMHVIQTPTMAQMYAGTAFGSPAGSPPTQQNIFDVASGNNTDIYMLTDNGLGIGSYGEFARFTRVDASTMKVTGEWFVSATSPPPMTCVMHGSWAGGVVNTTASHTIVAYSTNFVAFIGPQILDGTGMAPIGFGPTPQSAASAQNVIVVAGAKHPDGSCDFLMLDPDIAHPTTGNIDIWRIKVSNSLTITSTKTGTVNTLSIFSPGANLFVGEADYDPVHDTIIMVANSGAAPNYAPSWLMSVNYNGSINWWQAQPVTGGSVANKGQSRLTGTTFMTGTTDHLQIYDTGTGNVTFTGSVPISVPPTGINFYVWDAGRMAYWTYTTLGSFTRIDFINGGGGGPGGGGTLKLAMDNVVATATPTLLEKNLVWLSWSNDRGHSFGNPVSQPIGEAGEYRTSLQWQRLEYSRDRVFKLEWSSPQRTALQGCWVDVTPAQS